jgi:hypothetical protein
MIFVHHCLDCGVKTKHRHLHDAAHGLMQTHMVGSERFVCKDCGRTTFAHSDGADTFRFVLDGAAQERVRA